MKALFNMILTKERKKVSDNLSKHWKKESHDPLIVNRHLDKPEPEGEIADTEGDAHKVGENQVSASLSEFGILRPISREL